MSGNTPIPTKTALLGTLAVFLLLSPAKMCINFARGLTQFNWSYLFQLPWGLKAAIFEQSTYGLLASFFDLDNTCCVTNPSFEFKYLIVT